MKKINCLLVDDEPLAMDVLAAYINKVQGFEVVAKCGNAIEALSILRKKEVDLIFLDIEMPQLSGLELLNIVENPPKVIFTTAHRDYALQGYEFDAVDYLLKPIPFSRFLKAINKLHRTIPIPVEPVPPQFEHRTNPELTFIYVKEDKKMVKIYLKDILYIESLKDYVSIFTTSKRIVTKQQISYLDKKLPENKFLRIHRSYIISLDRIHAFSTQTIEIGKKELPIGRSYKTTVMSRLTSKGVRI